MKRTRIKICGITSLEDGLMAAAAGCDAIGFNFYQQSPRYIAPETAKQICSALPAFVSRVGLFVNPEKQVVRKVLDTVGIDMLQFHGDEDEAFCQSFAKPYLKVIHAGNIVSGNIANIAIEILQQGILDKIQQYPSATAYLIDNFDPQVIGGTGKTFNWNTIPTSIRHRIILAGGLHAGNVAEAIAQISPYAVDVSSGVEKLIHNNEAGVKNSLETEKGKKDSDRLAEFIEVVVQADLSR